MQLLPSREARLVAVLGAACIVLGALLRSSGILACGSALVLSVMVARFIAFLAVAEIRQAGFEMVWHARGTYSVVTIGEQHEVSLTIRNRSQQTITLRELKLLGSGSLAATLANDLQSVVVAPDSEISILCTLQPKRIGTFSLAGLSLRAHGVAMRGHCAYQIPLVFFSQHGVLVTPAHERRRRFDPERTASPSGKGHKRSGGDDFRELRDYVPGDARKNIAWRSSARRGKLLVREWEEPTQDNAWVLLEARAEHFGGAPGATLGDWAVARAWHRLLQLERVGARVGLLVFDGRLLASAGPEDNASAKLACLLHATRFSDADRAFDEGPELRRFALELLRAKAPIVGDELVSLLRDSGISAPFRRLYNAPLGVSPDDIAIRTYLQNYGVELAPTSFARRDDAALLAALAHAEARLSKNTKRGRNVSGSIHLVALAHAGLTSERALATFARLRRAKIRVSLDPYQVPPKRTSEPERIANGAEVDRSKKKDGEGPEQLAKLAESAQQQKLYFETKRVLRALKSSGVRVKSES
jgi:uncharacterized protein (DUF58 family)